MNAPLVVLAAGAVLGGLVLGLQAEGGLLERFLDPVIGAADHGHLGLPEAVLVGISIVLAVLAVLVAWYVWASGRVNWAAFPERQPELAAWLANAFYINALYAWLVRTAGMGVGRAFRTVDDRVVDGAVNEVAEEIGQASRLASVLQSGYVRSYALAFLLGAAALLLYLGLRF
jgi:NADH-quinone oxidoreductase subunit L